MLEEVIGCFLSFFSAVTLESPQISREENRHENQAEQSTSWISRHNIFRELVYGFEDENLPSQTEYVQLENEVLNKPTYIQSLFRSLKTTFIQTIAVFPLVLIGIVLIYFDLRTTDLCSEWKRKNYPLYAYLRRMTLFGKAIQSAIIYHGFFSIFIVLFGWNEFKSHYFSSISINLLASLIHALFIAFLLVYDDGNLDTSLVAYDIPISFMFVLVVLWQCGIVGRKIRQNHPTLSYTCCYIFTVLAVPLFNICALA